MANGIYERQVGWNQFISFIQSVTWTEVEERAIMNLESSLVSASHNRFLSKLEAEHNNAREMQAYLRW
jgi:hypothetical protein